MHTQTRRRGFTLIELLVVIAIIAVLIGLLVPAVQKVREASSRTQCQNNLHQMCLGLHSYATVKGAFPPAFKTDASNVYGPGWGWGAFLLPYVEQDALYKALGVETQQFGLPWGYDPAYPSYPAATPNALTQTILPIYRCPSDNGPGLNPARLNFATSNYRAVMGAFSVTAYNAAAPLPFTYPNYTYGFFYLELDVGGVMFQNSRIKLSHIKDGTSNTLAVGECILNATAPTWVGKWGSIWAGMTGGHTRVDNGAFGIFISDNMWWMDENSATINGPAPQAFSSWHSGGAVFGFCDGSVRFFRDSIAPATVMAMASRNDGIVVDYAD